MYKICTLNALFESNLKTTKNASAEHHLGSEAEREEMKNVQRALCVGCARENCTDSKMKSYDAGHIARSVRA